MTPGSSWRVCQHTRYGLPIRSIASIFLNCAMKVEMARSSTRISRDGSVVCVCVCVCVCVRARARARARDDIACGGARRLVDYVFWSTKNWPNPIISAPRHCNVTVTRMSQMREILVPRLMVFSRVILSASFFVNFDADNRSFFPDDWAMYFFHLGCSL